MKDLNITIIQTLVHWEKVDANLSAFDLHFQKIPFGSTDIIVLGEMFSTGFSMNAKLLAEKMGDKAMNWMRSKAKEKNAVVTGSLIIEENGNYYNRLIWMRADGSFETYDKRHLFRYANEQNYYTSGETKLIVDIHGWKICPMICYDLRFPVWTRRTATEAYDVLIFVANWPERRGHHWKSLLPARAIENQSFVVGVNRIGKDGNNFPHAGDSAVYNAKGERISITQPDTESIESIRLSRKELDEWRTQFPAWQDADEFHYKSLGS